MLVELRGKSQITIPLEVIEKLGASEGDKFELVEKDGGIFLCPVIVYPEETIAKLAERIKECEKEISPKCYTSVEEMLKSMGEEI